ncbi:hypothetical protein ACJ41O_007142 [Fusarium nematophilum]
MKFFASSSVLLAVSNLLLAATPVSAEESCACSVRYIVVEMPSASGIPSAAADAADATKPAKVLEIESEGSNSKPSKTAAAHESKTTVHAATKTAAQHNTTVIFTPVPCPDEDSSNPENAVPKKKVSLSYGAQKGTVPANSTGSDGAINMSIDMDKPAVVLDSIASVTDVHCSDDAVTVKFGKSDAFGKAKKSWADGGFTLITSGMSGCDSKYERSFFLVEDVELDEGEKTITCRASRHDLSKLAESCEMTFSSIPSATLRKRITLNPSVSLNFGAGLPEDTVLFKEDPWVTITADQAEFASTVTFSGYLKYNFWGFKLQQLYFDIDTQFSADVALSADVAAAWSRSIVYDPDALTYNIIDVPGIVSLGPGVAFAVGVDIDTSAAVSVTAGAGISIPNGNVHLDVVNSANTGTSGWEPQYNSYANISESVEVGLNASTSVTVQLTFKLLGGLVDLSSGLTATPGFINKFTLDAVQSVGASNDGTTVDVEGKGDAECNVAFKSDFVFELEGFATQWWRATLYEVELPIADICYDFEQQPASTGVTAVTTAVTAVTTTAY